MPVANATPFFVIVQESAPVELQKMVVELPIETYAGFALKLTVTGIIVSTITDVVVETTPLVQTSVKVVFFVIGPESKYDGGGVEGRLIQLVIPAPS